MEGILIMKKLNSYLRVVSRTGKNAYLVGIDLEAKTIHINTNDKDLSFATALSYKLFEANETLTEKVLTRILTADEALPKAGEPEDQEPEATDEEAIPYGTFETHTPNATDDTLKYIPDLAEKIGCTQKNLRKRLRKLEELGFIIKRNHTWCWDDSTFESMVAMLKDKVDTAEDPQNGLTYANAHKLVPMPGADKLEEPKK